MVSLHRLWTAAGSALAAVSLSALMGGGRPCTPVECYLRLMFLKFRYRLGFESLWPLRAPASRPALELVGHQGGNQRARRSEKDPG